MNALIILSWRWDGFTKKLSKIVGTLRNIQPESYLGENDKQHDKKKLNKSITIKNKWDYF